jgi:uncharacterized membrane protein HdeD (DUF308 family)
MTDAGGKTDKGLEASGNPAGLGHWGLVVVLGLLLGALGLTGVSLSFASSPIPPLGWFLLASGFLQALHALSVRPHRSFSLDLLASAFYVVAGMVVVYPATGAGELALLLGPVFMVLGVFRAVTALVQPIVGRLPVFLAGLVSLYLGINLWMRRHTATLWLVGLFIGIDIALTGWSLVMRGLGEKRLSARMAAPSPDERYP